MTTNATTFRVCDRDEWDEYKASHEFMPCEEFGQCSCDPFPDSRCKALYAYHGDDCNESCAIAAAQKEAGKP